jgi:hypothetical protein
MSTSAPCIRLRRAGARACASAKTSSNVLTASIRPSFFASAATCTRPSASAFTCALLKPRPAATASRKNFPRASMMLCQYATCSSVIGVPSVPSALHPAAS